MTQPTSDVTLDEDNPEFNRALTLACHSDQPVYLTGKAGTGKTTFLKHIKDITDKNTVILAPTGVAALNAGGMTLHSFFQIPFGPFFPDDDSRLRSIRYRKNKRKIIEELELLIVDEISMVRADLLDFVDKILRTFRQKEDLPFGGVQVILIGDAFQLPPVTKSEEWEGLSTYYKTPFFFGARVVEQNPPLHVELKKIYRQKDQDFIDLLQRIRVNQVTLADFQTLNAKYDPDFSSRESDYITLATHRSMAEETNLTQLKQLPTPLVHFEAKVTGKFPDHSLPTDHLLGLKVGAQVMFLKNDTGQNKRYYNGKIGKITAIDAEEETITVAMKDPSEVKVKRAAWQNVRYQYNEAKKCVEEEVIGTLEQLPLQLAWAITVHKSQGLTFEKVIADLGQSFAPGQVYVALSRCTSLSGLQLKTELNPHAIKTDPDVLEFARQLEMDES